MPRSKGLSRAVLTVGVFAAAQAGAQEESASPRAAAMQMAERSEPAAMRADAGAPLLSGTFDTGACGAAGKRIQRDIRGSIEGGRCGEAESVSAH